MTKAEIIQLLVENSGLPKREAAESVELFLECVKAGLEEEGKVSLVGFGTFMVKAKESRNGRNPRTGEIIHIPPKNVPVFKAGKAFRHAINKSTPASKAKVGTAG